jgi:uncharacterized protein (DUF305 family)
VDGKVQDPVCRDATKEIRMTLHLPISTSIAALLLATNAWAQSASAPATGHGSGQMAQAMKSGMDAMAKMPMSGDPDKDFAMMMKLHHQQAVDMAKVEAEQGRSPELKAMARKMMSDQQKEIQQLDAWLKTHH